MKIRDVNRYRWPLLLAVLAAIGLAAWTLFSVPQPSPVPKPVPAAAPALEQAAPPGAESTDDDLVA